MSAASALPVFTLPFAGVLVCACVVLALAGEYGLSRWFVYVFKPLATVLILGVALGGTSASPTYRWLIVAGLAFSLAGDVFLMLPGDRFVAGLASFFIAHLLYIAAFVCDGRFRLPLAVILPLLAYALFLLWIVQPGAGKLAPVVALYAGALAAMAWVAVGHWAEVKTQPAEFAAIGGMLFVVSDSALAVNRFWWPFHAAQLVVLATYFGAQWLIALST
ncbi:MAG TPA: lysoplasmalogenase [Longimicrobiaceae bacterium]|nr:lysoplasmalogenase [Longimicrobiaceae bacterium]